MSRVQARRARELVDAEAEARNAALKAEMQAREQQLHADEQLARMLQQQLDQNLHPQPLQRAPSIGPAVVERQESSALATGWSAVPVCPCQPK